MEKEAKAKIKKLSEKAEAERKQLEKEAQEYAWQVTFVKNLLGIGTMTNPQIALAAQVPVALVESIREEINNQ